MSALFSGSVPAVTKIEIDQKIQEVVQTLILPADSKVLGSIGDGSSQVFMLSEAAGPNDAKIGQPFTGPFSQNFNNLLLPSVGLSRQTIYLTNLVKNSQPIGQNLPAGLIQAWSQIVPLEIALVRPKLIVTMGKHALEFFLPKAKLTDIRGQLWQIELFKDYKVALLPLIHPANSHRFPEQLPQIQQEFLLIKEFLQGQQPKPVPTEFLKDNSGSEELF